MQVIEALRKATLRAAENELHRRQPRQTSSQAKVQGRGSDYAGQPNDSRGWTQLQDLTPGSPTLGQFLP